MTTDSTALAKFKRQLAERRRNLLDPKYGHKRFYPRWTMGLTTLHYIRTYNALNHMGPNPLRFTFADRVAPFNPDEELSK
jgi:hypothetical protein